MPGRRLDSVRVEWHRPHTRLLLYQPVEHLCIEGVGGRLRVFPLLGRVHREAARPTGEQKLSGKGKSCHLTHTKKTRTSVPGAMGSFSTLTSFSHQALPTHPVTAKPCALSHTLAFLLPLPTTQLQAMHCNPYPTFWVISTSTPPHPIPREPAHSG